MLAGLIGLALPSQLLLALPCTALVAVVGLLVALEVRLRPLVSREYPLAETPQALQDLLARRAVGKLVIRP